MEEKEDIDQGWDWHNSNHTGENRACLINFSSPPKKHNGCIIAKFAVSALLTRWRQSSRSRECLHATLQLRVSLGSAR